MIVTSEMDTTHSAVEIGAVQAQKILPGINPLKAIESLPGVLYETADPWGNNEQNESLVMHGFTTQQLGYTMDGVPLGRPAIWQLQRPQPVARHDQRKCRQNAVTVLRRRFAGRGLDQQSGRRDRNLFQRSVT